MNNGEGGSGSLVKSDEQFELMTKACLVSPLFQIRQTFGVIIQPIFLADLPWGQLLKRRINRSLEPISNEFLSIQYASGGSLVEMSSRTFRLHRLLWFSPAGAEPQKAMHIR